MQSSCLRHSEIPGTSRLFQDFLYRFDRVAPFFSHSYLDPGCWAKAAGDVVFPAERRAALVSALRTQNGASVQLDLLARPGTVVVVTGQQVGLFGGPCYTIYKALTAARLAASLMASGIPAVPVFWLATEDHDFAEVNHAWVFDQAMEPRKLQVDVAGQEQRPVGGVVVDRFPVEELKAALAGMPFAAEVSALVEECYVPGATMGAAFGSLLRRLLPDLGLLYLDPMDPAIRAIAAPIVRDAVLASGDLKARLIERDSLLEQSGYHAQVHVEKSTSLFFLLEDGRRTTLRYGDDRYAGLTGKWTVGELADRAEQLSPNALLRPVVQDYLLPTVAQVGGPAEVAYLAQSQVLYQALGRVAPVAVPRSGFTLFDARAGKLMSRYGLSPGDFFEGLGPLKERISRKLVPTGLQASIAETRVEAEKLMGRLESSLAEFDASLAAATAKSRTKILYQVSKIETKAARQALACDGRAAADAEYLFNLVYPHKHLQERLYGVLPFLGTYGFGLVGEIAEFVRLECPDHVVLTV